MRTKTLAAASSGARWFRGWKWVLLMVAAFSAGDAAALVELSGIAAVAAGEAHTCALTTGGAVKCWGRNLEGQLGDGTVARVTTPVDVDTLSRAVTAIAAGSNHTCAITAAGAVKCWGDNRDGQLGNGIPGNALVPADVPGLPGGVAAIAAGASHTCALTTAGAVKCWGANTDGQLGDGTSVDAAVPVDVAALSGVQAISAGAFHTCALTTLGAVKCWGDNGSGQLGNGTTVSAPLPVDVGTLAGGVQAIALGRSHTCALTTAGAVRCWGRNSDGQLGDGTAANALLPVAVPTLSSAVAAIATGQSHTCALTAGGAVRCWGRNGDGQLGDGTMTERRTPVDVAMLSGAVQAIAAGHAHTCALSTAGTLKCWGSNSSGQAGDGLDTNATTPVNVATLATGVAAIGAGDSHTCAVTTAGAAKCWGRNGDGQLGDGTRVQAIRPVDVASLSTGVEAVAAGTFHSCALTAGGGVKCWGANYGGQLGNGGAGFSATPVDVATLSSGVRAIAAGEGHSCALTAAGGVKCWGEGALGQLGNGAMVAASTPVDVSTLSTGVQAIAAGADHTCALTTAGAVKCWGWNNAGQLGNDPSANAATPVDVATLSTGVAAIATGGNHTCALTTAGAVKCWGQNVFGQVGNGSLVSTTTPVDVANLSSGVLAIAAGLSHTCALTTAGAVKCWGANGNGQLGNGTLVDSTVPVDVAALSGVQAISAGGFHTCALTAAGAAQCWGFGGLGQLGNGAAIAHPVPVVVMQVEPSLVKHFYAAILRRAPDAGGKAFWEGERARVVALGANVNEAWFAMAQSFYASAEYAALNRDDAGFVTDLYSTFFERPPDAGGMAFWQGLLQQGMPREVALASFMFSPEFINFTQAIFGNTAARPEVDTVMDFYRGLLSRLPDDGGFAFWRQQFRTAQCQGAGAVTAQAEAISSAFALSAEYAARARTNAQYVGDLYNAFLRRGGDLGGVQFWIGQIDSGALTRESVRRQFIASPEFQGRVQAIIAAGCLP